MGDKEERTTESKKNNTAANRKDKANWESIVSGKQLETRQDLCKSATTIVTATINVTAIA